MWEASVRIANDNPILGGGFDVIYLKEVIVKYIPLGVMPRAIHSAYFQMIAEHGYVGLAIYLVMLYMTFHYARRIAKRSEEMADPLFYKDLSTAIRCSLAGYMVMGLTANIAFFDLIYFVIVATAITDGIMEKVIAPKRQFDLHAKPALAV